MVASVIRECEKEETGSCFCPGGDVDRNEAFMVRVGIEALFSAVLGVSVRSEESLGMSVWSDGCVGTASVRMFRIRMDGCGSEQREFLCGRVSNLDEENAWNRVMENGTVYIMGIS